MTGGVGLARERPGNDRSGKCGLGVGRAWAFAAPPSIDRNGFSFGGGLVWVGCVGDVFAMMGDELAVGCAPVPTDPVIPTGIPTTGFPGRGERPGVVPPPAAPV